MSPLIIILGVAGVIFALLLMFGKGGRRASISPAAGNATEIVVAGLASINIAGTIGLGWFAAVILAYDGVMVIELSICAGLMAVLILLTGGAFALKRRGKTAVAVALLIFAALPTIAVYGFLLYLGVAPIDWR